MQLGSGALTDLPYIPTFFWAIKTFLASEVVQLFVDFKTRRYFPVHLVDVYNVDEVKGSHATTSA